VSFWLGIALFLTIFGVKIIWMTVFTLAMKKLYSFPISAGVASYLSQGMR